MFSQVYILSESLLVFMNIYLLISENVRNSIQACYSCGWIVLSCDSSSPLRSVWVGTGTCLSEWTFTATAGMTFSFDELTFYPWTLIILQLQFDRLKLMIMSRTSIWLSQEIPCNQYWTCIAILMVCFWGYHTLCSDRDNRNYSSVPSKNICFSPKLPDQLWSPSILSFIGYWELLLVVVVVVVAMAVVGGSGVGRHGHKVDQSFHLVLRLRMRRVLPPLPHMPSSCARSSFYLHFVSKFW